MKSRSKRPLVYIVLVAVLAAGAYFFRDKIFRRDKDNPQVDIPPVRDTTEIRLPERFDWRQYITRAPELQRPVREMPRGPQVEVDAECVYIDGQLQPVIHLSYQTPRRDPEMRMDLTLVHDGFVRNQYTILYPLKQKERFQLPITSFLMQDTAAISILGAGQFPVLEAYRVDPVPMAGGGQAFRHNFQLKALSNGVAYHLRVAESAQEFWSTTREVVITTPACPNDAAELDRRESNLR